MNIDGFALVTGAGSGIGRDCAFAYSAEGAAGVAFADIDEAAAKAAAKESEAFAANPAYRAVSMRVDVSNEESVDEMIRRTVEAFGRIDYGVNSAGIGVQAPADIANVDMAEFARFFNINVKGTLLCTRALSKQMRTQEPIHLSSRPKQSTPAHDRGRGSIINLGSCNSYVATPNITQYTTSKHAVLGLTRNAALDNAAYGVRVNCICPSWVETPMIDAAVKGDPGLKGIMTRVVPMGRIARREEVSDVVLFMSSPRASFVTGAGWLVDGGATLMMQT